MGRNTLKKHINKKENFTRWTSKNEIEKFGSNSVLIIENLNILHDDCLKIRVYVELQIFQTRRILFTFYSFQVPRCCCAEKYLWQSVPGIIERKSGTTFFKNCIFNNKKTNYRIIIFESTGKPDENSHGLRSKTRLGQRRRYGSLDCWTSRRVFIMFVPPSSRLRRQPARITTTETRRRIPQSPELHPTGKPLRKLLHGRVTLPRSWSSFTSAALHIVIGVVTAVRGGVPGF